MSAIHQSLLRVQKALRPAKRTQTAERDGEAFDYADLKSVIAACLKKLNDEGILLTQNPSALMIGAVFMVSVETRLWKVDGEQLTVGDTVEGTVSCPCPPDRQEYAATVTVLRRVGLASLVGLVQEESKIGDGINMAHSLINGRRAASEGK